MARAPRLAALRRALRTRRAGWGLAAALTLLGILLGWDRLTDAARVAGLAFAHTARLILDAGLLLLLRGPGRTFEPHGQRSSQRRGADGWVDVRALR
jgi:hypothetical protein